MFWTQNLISRAEKIIILAQKKHVKIALAESCTGGLLSALFTEISGSSAVFERGFIVYSNQAKTEMLQVKKEIIEKFGAVSEQVALAMAQGALKNSAAEIALAITGIAGPDGGSQEKPVGLVYIALAKKDSSCVILRKFNFFGNRQEVRKAAIIESLHIIENACSHF